MPYNEDIQPNELRHARKGRVAVPVIRSSRPRGSGHPQHHNQRGGRGRGRGRGRGPGHHALSTRGRDVSASTLRNLPPPAARDVPPHITPVRTGGPLGLSSQNQKCSDASTENHAVHSSHIGQVKDMRLEVPPGVAENPSVKLEEQVCRVLKSPIFPHSGPTEIEPHIL